jgi:hypothetical protein
VIFHYINARRNVTRYLDIDFWYLIGFSDQKNVNDPKMCECRRQTNPLNYYIGNSIGEKIFLLQKNCTHSTKCFLCKWKMPSKASDSAVSVLCCQHN